MHRITINLSGRASDRFRTARENMGLQWVSDAGFARYLLLVGLEHLETQLARTKRTKRSRKASA